MSFAFGPSLLFTPLDLPFVSLSPFFLPSYMKGNEVGQHGMTLNDIQCEGRQNKGKHDAQESVRPQEQKQEQRAAAKAAKDGGEI